MDKLTKLAKAITFKSHTIDGERGLSPGVTLSVLPNGKFYGSIITYSGSLSSKRVLVKATGDSFEQVVDKLAREFLTSIERSSSPIDDLAADYKLKQINDDTLY